jgi:beta-phosphoglucomutase-like phosphatase (HAD superfamily)
MKILLFDMDGVLLDPQGYHRALMETVRLMGAALGFEGARITREQIAKFEAVGLTNEWHSGAICTALMLLEARVHHPGTRLPLTASQVEARYFFPPDCFNTFLDQAFLPVYSSVPSLNRAVAILTQLAEVSGLEARELVAILGTSELPEHSIVHRTHQEHVLGSRVFASTYKMSQQFEVPSYLTEYDQPALDENAHQELLRWFEPPQHTAAILTNRPSKSFPESNSTPEAQLGRQLVGLESLPMVGSGELLWLADQTGDTDPQFKPSPLHALAALLVAVGVEVKTALFSAYSLANGSQPGPEWEPLRGAEINVFEDASSGIESTRSAAALLESHGLPNSVHAFGVTSSPQKKRALEERGVQVFTNLGDALALFYETK